MGNPITLFPSGIYRIVNRTNGKMYIGSTVNFQHRWYVHRRKLNSGAHHSPRLQAAWDKYGEQQFEFQVLLYCAKEDLIFYEQAALSLYRVAEQRRGYNVASIAGSRLGIPISDAVRRKIAKALQGKTKTPEHTAKVAAANRGIKRTDEARKKMSIAALNRSEDAKRHVAAAAVKRAADPAYRQRIADTLRGRKLPPEHCASLSKARAMFTPEQADEIRRLRRLGYTRRQLAKRFDCSDSTIKGVIYNKRLAYKQD